MSCIFSPVPVAHCSEQQLVLAGVGEEGPILMSPALAPLLIAVLLLVCVLLRQVRGPRRPW